MIVTSAAQTGRSAVIDSIQKFSVSPERRYCLVAHLSVATLIDLQTEKTLLNVHPAEALNQFHLVTYVALSSRHNKLLTGCLPNRTDESHERAVQLWDGTTGALLYSFGSPYELSDLAISSDGQKAICCYAGGLGTVQCWDTINRKLLWEQTFSGSDSNPGGLQYGAPSVWISAARFSPNDREILVSASLGLFIINAETGHIKKQFSPDLGAGVFCEAWSDNGTKVLTGGSTLARLLDVSKTNSYIDFRLPELRCGFVVQAQEVHCVDFSPDGSKTVTCSPEGGTWIWDTATVKPSFQLEKFCCYGAAFVGDGSEILTLDKSEGGKLKLWNANSGVFLKKINFKD
jgi:WD40 repeat protein